MQWAEYEPLARTPSPGMGSQLELPSQQVVQPHSQERNQPENQVRKIQAPAVPYSPPVEETPSVPQPVPKKRKSDLSDISEYDEVMDFVYIFIAGVVSVVGLIIVVRAFPEVFGKNLNLLFNRFKLVSVLGYVLMMCLVLGVTRYLYSEFIFLQHNWNPLYFSLLTALTQMFHDLVMYYGAINYVERGGNGILDLLKDYVESGGSRILFGNALLTTFVGFGAMLLKGTPAHIIASIAGVAVYLLPFALEAKNEFSNIS
jgi:hypothetical protein